MVSGIFHTSRPMYNYILIGSSHSFQLSRFDRELPGLQPPTVAQMTGLSSKISHFLCFHGRFTQLWQNFMGWNLYLPPWRNWSRTLWSTSRTVPAYVSRSEHLVLVWILWMEAGKWQYCMYHSLIYYVTYVTAIHT